MKSRYTILSRKYCNIPPSFLFLFLLFLLVFLLLLLLLLLLLRFSPWKKMQMKIVIFILYGIQV
jgi:hypothetical protein